ncbi:TetR/AcrR family transcriptional regulator [Criblamydia sequanensis]|uniref:Transcriptional regulator n=1 Tax=Candidatus Criblamydia sequanensis CRIB-18 TaxID=1437425 RepID=A0A090D273_9BACT|nr:TetR/AcrR family transcriptional regulator [Criblamydia sequanensis]CDR34108.1 Transcriptional regulator [Criblamydia sequanensis CRIB-18]
MTKPINRKNEILKVARNLFLTKDYDKATMGDIMDALEIAKGTIYHYFRSKEALFEAVIEDIVEENIKHMRTLVKNTPKNALEKIQLLVNAGNISQENEKILEQLHKPANDALHSRLLAATLMKQAPLYAEIIQQGCAEGIFKTEVPLECAEFILSAIQFLTDMGIYPWTEQDLKRRMQAFPILIERLLQAPPGSFQFLV